MRSPWYLVVSVIMMFVASYFVIAVISPMMNMIQEMSDFPGRTISTVNQLSNWLMPSVFAGFISSFVLIILGSRNIKLKIQPLWQTIIGLIFCSLSTATWFMWILVVPKINDMYMDLH